MRPAARRWSTSSLLLVIVGARARAESGTRGAITDRVDLGTAPDVGRPRCSRRWSRASPAPASRPPPAWPARCASGGAALRARRGRSRRSPSLVLFVGMSVAGADGAARWSAARRALGERVRSRRRCSASSTRSTRPGSSDAARATRSASSRRAGRCSRRRTAQMLGIVAADLLAGDQPPDPERSSPACTATRGTPYIAIVDRRGARVRARAARTTSSSSPASSPSAR